MKKFDFKLTAFLVSLFIGLILIILGNLSKYCLSFGLILVAVSLVIYALRAQEKGMGDMVAIQTALEETDDEYEIKELKKLQANTKKKLRGLNIVCYISAFLFVLLGFSNLF